MPVIVYHPAWVPKWVCPHSVKLNCAVREGVKLQGDVLQNNLCAVSDA